MFGLLIGWPYCCSVLCVSNLLIHNVFKLIFFYFNLNKLFRAFSLFGEIGKFIISGGNDKSVKLWDWSKYYDARQSNDNNDLHLNISLSKKVGSYCFSS